MKIPLIICGAFGRMGRELVEMACCHNNFFIKACVVKHVDERSLSPEWNFPFYDDLDAALRDHSPAVIIDFSVAANLASYLTTASQFSSPLLIATTGHKEEDMGPILEASRTIPIVMAPNTSLMANLLIALSSLASARLKQSEASILEIHHATKKDMPSGTALALAKAIAENKPHQKIDISSMRKGTTLGEHTVFLFNEYDRLELTHRVADRRIFAEGALVAAQFPL